MNPKTYYQQQIKHYSDRLAQIKRKRNFITAAKLILFGIFIFLIYLLITGSTLPLYSLGVGVIILFIAFTMLDSKIVYQQHLTEELLRINTVETDYLTGNLSSLPQGRTYNNPTHPYANDLDLFGEESLFQHLNRTATLSGTDKLVSWLLNLSKDIPTILARQEAVAELTIYPEWCQRFRAYGKLHPTQVLNSEILKTWPTESSFFAHEKNTRFILWICNSIVIIFWVLTLFTSMPAFFPLFLSLSQLLALSFFLKKINTYHERLNLFLRTISNYLPLVKLMHKQSFHATYLQKLARQLFSEEHDALQALSQLQSIQNGLDQRGNVVSSFILNGLYMRDLHLLIRLDKWKKAHSQYIASWTEAISEIDALISMANYRFNHPTYTFPVISNTSLLDAQDIGHPLLKSERNITNNFKIDTLHQIAIITGANMAGKSTFLRTIGVNLILAQSGNVVCSSHLSFQPIALFTSMRTTDNLAKDTSYFHAELLRLQQLVTIASHEEKVFIILDEMLKGTNSVDKLNGSLAFLRKLLAYPIAGLVATHDLALGQLETTYPEHFQNACFEIIHTDTGISYDYKLHPGISSNMNASILLKQMGLI